MKISRVRELNDELVMAEENANALFRENQNLKEVIDTRDRQIELMKVALFESNKLMLEVIEPCDHDVNICWCGWRRQIETNQEL